MQIIQNIREKGAVVIIVALVIALIGFILMDARTSMNNSNGNSKNFVSTVNGKEVNEAEYKSYLASSKRNAMMQRQGQPLSKEDEYGIQEQAYTQANAATLIFEEARKQGIVYGANELNYILYSNLRFNPLTQSNEFRGQDGKIDPSKVAEFIKNAKKSSNKKKKEEAEQENEGTENMVKNFTENFEPEVRFNSIFTRYNNMLTTLAYTPSWVKKQKENDATNYANISYVAIPYSKISDSTITITDKDYNEFVAENPKRYNQEDGRFISYLSFNAAPNQADSTKVFNDLVNLKSSFLTDTNAKNFVNKNSKSVYNTEDFLTKDEIQPEIFKQINGVTTGNVTGPNLVGNNYGLVKVLGQKSIPTIVKMRHILVQTKDQQGNVTKEDGAAKNLADSILKRAKAGEDFSALAKQYSEDPGSKEKGGIYDSITKQTNFVPEFKDYGFTKPVGEKGVIKTSFGYHVIEVVEIKKSDIGYKLAVVQKPIIASNITTSTATDKANEVFRASGGNVKKLDEYLSKNNLSKTKNPQPIKETDFQIMGLTDAKEIIRWAYKEAKAGEVGKPINVGDMIAIPILERVQKEGLVDIENAKQTLKSVVLNKLKAKQILKKLGDNPTLETAMASYEGLQTLTAGDDSTLTLYVKNISNVGPEMKLIGAVFNKANLNKVAKPIEGTAAVYVFKTNSINKKAFDSKILEGQQLGKNIASNASYWYMEGLQKTVTIKDKRDL